MRFQFLHAYIRMLGLFSKKTSDAPVDLAAGERYDSTLRPVCFGLSNKVSKEAAAKVGPEKFKRYEHILYIGAQLSRIVYSDSGIIWNTIEKSLGMSSDIVNKVISAYDARFLSQRRTTSSAPGSEGGRPMESYSLTVAKPGPGEKKYATYVSSPSDITCLVINATKVKENPNSILQPTDVFVVFKGSSTIKNFKHDLMSQFTASDLGGLIQSIGVKVGMNEGRNLVTGAFIKPLVKAWTSLINAITEHITADGRLFLCGHSLGGAYCTLFAFILAEGKVSGTIPIMSKVKSIHIISYGAPTLLSDTARNTFNRHLESGLMTLDRVVSQKVAARSAATQLLVGAFMGPNDVIPTIPVGFAHPGFRPLATEFRPEANGRPYSIDNIRKFYGVSSNTRYRDPATWPFSEDMGLGDWKNSAALNNIVKELTGVDAPPNKDPVAESQAAEVSEDPTIQQGGFGEQKGIYSAATKNHIPDYVSVAGSNYAAGFAHMEYLGMFFAGALRMAGMKNPGYGNRTAYFGLYNSGVELSYQDYKVNQAVDSVPQAALPQGESDSDAGVPAAAAAPTSPPANVANKNPGAQVVRGGYRKTRKARNTRRKVRHLKKSSKLRRR